MNKGIDIHTGYLQEKTLRILSELEMLEGEWPTQQLSYGSATGSLNYIADKAQNIIDECEKLKKLAKKQHEQNVIENMKEQSDGI